MSDPIHLRDISQSTLVSIKFILHFNSHVYTSIVIVTYEPFAYIPRERGKYSHFLCAIAVGHSIVIIENRAQQHAHMNDLNQGQNQGQPQAAPVQAPPVLPAPPQAQPAPPQPAAPLLPPPPPPVVPAAPPFALAPGRNNHILDWTNPAHTKQYYKATYPLDSTEKFDGQPNKICLFL